MRRVTPNTVSRALVAGGVRAVPRDREGIHLSSGNAPVSVEADVDGPRAAVRLSTDAFDVLRDAGFDVIRTSATSFRVIENGDDA